MREAETAATEDERTDISNQVDNEKWARFCQSHGIKRKITSVCGVVREKAAATRRKGDVGRGNEEKPRREKLTEASCPLGKGPRIIKEPSLQKKEKRMGT